MKKHLTAFVLASTSASAAFQNVPWLNDGILSPFPPGFMVGRDTRLLAAIMHSPTTNLTRGQLDLPSARMISLPDLIHVSQGATPPSPFRIINYVMNPFTIPASERILINAINNNAGDKVYAGLWLGENAGDAPKGERYTLHGVSTDAAVQDKWSVISITWDQLPKTGTYCLIGSYHTSSHCIFHRWIQPEHPWRPGSISGADTTQYLHDLFWSGGMGYYLNFTNWQMPQCEVLCNGNDNAHEVWLEFLKVSDSAQFVGVRY